MFFHPARRGGIGRENRIVLYSLPPRGYNEPYGNKDKVNENPAKAITMKKKKPHIDRGVCIHCFCCQEFCPKGAMRQGRHAIMKILGK